MFKQTLIVLLGLVFLFFHLYADTSEKGIYTGLPIPRYVSLKSDLVKLRIGPGIRYQTSYIYNCIHYPVQIIAEFNNWRKVKDVSNIQGWIHQSLLSGSRYVIVSSNKILFQKHLMNKLTNYQSLIFKASNEISAPILKIEYGVLAKLVKCKEHWCKITIRHYNGWIRKINIWGSG